MWSNTGDDDDDDDVHGEKMIIAKGARVVWEKDTCCCYITWWSFEGLFSHSPPHDPFYEICKNWYRILIQTSWWWLWWWLWCWSNRNSHANMIFFSFCSEDFWRSCWVSPALNSEKLGSSPTLPRDTNSDHASGKKRVDTDLHHKNECCKTWKEIPLHTFWNVSRRWFTGSDSFWKGERERFPSID